MKPLVLIAFLISAFIAVCSGADAPQETLRCGVTETGMVFDIPIEPQVSVARTRSTLPPPAGPALRPANTAWVESTLASMTLDEKIGQMIMPARGASTNTHINTNRVGGIIFLGNTNTAPNLLNFTNQYQGMTSVPLLFAIDCEAGLGARTTDGTRFPFNMALAATRSTTMSQEQGRVTARECRSVGIHIGFGPVLDVNTEPINPIIGVRSFSNDPALVSTMASAYVQGANAEGLLCSYKHFPGHGATTGDSHDSLPVVDDTYVDLQAKHVTPYSTLLANNTVDLVMSAHVWFPSIDPGTNAWPATISKNSLNTILRGQLAYTGTIISDAYDMAGLLDAAPLYDAARLGVEAGLDIILAPTSVSTAISGIRDGVTSGSYTVERINQSVRRILTLKSRAGMPETTASSSAIMSATVAHPDHLAAAKEIAQNAICAAKVVPGVLPLTTSQNVLCLTSDGTSVFYHYSGSNFRNALQAILPGVSFTASQPYSSYDRIIFVRLSWVPTLSTSDLNTLTAIQNSGKPLIYVSFGSPYHILQRPTLSNYYCAFSTHFESQIQMAKILTGSATATGKWPVSISELQTSVDEWSNF